MSEARRALLQLLQLRALDLTEYVMLGFAGCGLTCPGGSERRDCPCTGPAECRLKEHPMFEKYKNRSDLASWVTAPPGGAMRIKVTVDGDGNVAWDTETI